VSNVVQMSGRRLDCFSALAVDSSGSVASEIRLPESLPNRLAGLILANLKDRFVMRYGVGDRVKRRIAQDTTEIRSLRGRPLWLGSPDHLGRCFDA
jgi:hypothetical protein